MDVAHRHRRRLIVYVVLTLFAAGAIYYTLIDDWFTRFVLQPGPMHTFQLDREPENLNDVEIVFFATLTMELDGYAINEWEPYFKESSRPDIAAVYFWNRDGERPRMVWLSLDGQTLRCHSQYQK